MTANEIKSALKKQAERLTKLTEFLAAARDYRDARNAADSTQKYDARLEAMIDVVDGKMPMMVKANDAAEIQSAVNFSIQNRSS